MKKRSHKLDLRPDFNFFLTGISSPENDYHLCWAINQQLKLNLQKTGNWSVFHPKLNATQEFSMYSYEEDESLLVYYLLSNRCENGFLIEELKNIDYFIQVHGDFPSSDQDRFINDLNKLDAIVASFPIDPLKLKSRNRLLIQ